MTAAWPLIVRRVLAGLVLLALAPSHFVPRRVLGVTPTALALVAAHAWDILGADRAGLTTGWVSRKETAFQPALGEPTVQGRTLTEVVEALLALKT